jgi:stage III sporulation protein SpoIIIAA
MQQIRITDDLAALLATLPPRLTASLEQTEELTDLLEVVLDLGRLPSARFPGREVRLGVEEVSHEDLEYVVARIVLRRRQSSRYRTYTPSHLRDTGKAAASSV